MKFLKSLFWRSKADDLIGGKTMDQIRKEHEIRMHREQMSRFPERFRNGGSPLTFE